MFYQFSKFPAFKGKGRIFKALFSERMKKAKDILVDGKFQCKYLLPNLKESVTRNIILNGIYEKALHEFLMKSIPNGATFIDVGANIGAILIPLKARRNDIKIVAVEAAPQVYAYLQKNLVLNNISDVILVNKAIYEESGLEMNFYSPKEEFGKGSLSPVFTDTPIIVNTITIDQLVSELNISEVEFIKVDVEGYEYFVFKGGENLLRKESSPDIIFEFVDWAEGKAKGIEVGASQRILKEFGYKIFSMSEKGVENELKGIITKGARLLFATKKL